MRISLPFLVAGAVMGCASLAWGRYCWWAGYYGGANASLCAEWQMQEGDMARQRPSCRSIADNPPPYFPGRQALP